MHPFSDPIFCSILLHAYTLQGVRVTHLSSNIILTFIYKGMFMCVHLYIPMRDSLPVLHILMCLIVTTILCEKNKSDQLHASVLLFQKKKKSFWSTHILTWDCVKTLGILTSDATTVWAAFLSTRAFRILVASADACCVEYGQWWAVRTEARLHVVIRQTLIYALPHKMS